MKEKLTRVQLKRSTVALLLEHRAAEKIAHAQAQDCPQVVHRKCRKAVAAKPCRDSRFGCPSKRSEHLGFGRQHGWLIFAARLRPALR